MCYQKVVLFWALLLPFKYQSPVVQNDEGQCKRITLWSYSFHSWSEMRPKRSRKDIKYSSFSFWNIDKVGFENFLHQGHLCPHSLILTYNRVLLFSSIWDTQNSVNKCLSSERMEEREEDGRRLSAWHCTFWGTGRWHTNCCDMWTRETGRRRGWGSYPVFGSAELWSQCLGGEPRVKWPESRLPSSPTTCHRLSLPPFSPRRWLLHTVSWTTHVVAIFSK